MRVLGLITLATLCLCSMGAESAHRRRPRTYTVTIESMRFQPAELSVVPGDSVVWVNKDLVPHSATSDRAGFDSKIIRANGSWRYTVPARKGTYSYTCTFHPTMAGRLRVK